MGLCSLAFHLRPEPVGAVTDCLKEPELAAFEQGGLICLSKETPFIAVRLFVAHRHLADPAVCDPACIPEIARDAP